MSPSALLKYAPLIAVLATFIATLIGIVANALDKRRTIRAETWKAMLTVSYAMAQKHYVQMGGATKALLYFAERYAEANDEPAREQYMAREYFYFLMLRMRLKHMVDSSGGFYFKSLAAEELANRCMNELFFNNYTQGGQELVLSNATAAAALLRPGETGDSFLQRLESETGQGGVLTRALQDFREWHRGGRYQSGLSCLRAFYAVLDCEANRPFEHWYGRKAKLEPDAEVWKTLYALAGGRKEASEELSKAGVLPAVLHRLARRKQCTSFCHGVICWLDVYLFRWTYNAQVHAYLCDGSRLCQWWHRWSTQGSQAPFDDPRYSKNT